MRSQSAESVENLYTEALRLASASRSYFDGKGKAERATLPAELRASLAIESVYITARLMAIVTWGLLRQAVTAGDIAAADVLKPDRRLGNADVTGARRPSVLARFPDRARSLSIATHELYEISLLADARLHGDFVAPGNAAMQGTAG